MKLRVSILALLILLAVPRLRAGELTLADSAMKSLVAAQMNDDFDAFVAGGTIELKAALTKTQFEAVAAQLVPRFKAGYEMTCLGELNMGGNEVYLYRFRFKDGGDDILGTLSLKDAKISGIYFH